MGCRRLKTVIIAPNELANTQFFYYYFFGAFNWLMESIQNLSQIGRFVQSWSKRSCKNYPVYFKFGLVAKINKKIDLLKILDFDAALE